MGKKKEIQISIYRGSIQDIKCIPKGYAIKVIDFDVEDDEHPLIQKINGKNAYVFEWKNN